jgi:hypothetical protein
MAKINYDVNVQIQTLANKFATSEVEVARLGAIVSGANKQIDDLTAELNAAKAQLEARQSAVKRVPKK